jgi:hypothetical protein
MRNFIIGLLVLVVPVTIVAFIGSACAGSVGFWAGLTFTFALMWTIFGLLTRHWAGTLLFVPVWVLEMLFIFLKFGPEYMTSVVHAQRDGLKWIFSANSGPWILGLGLTCIVISLICKGLCRRYG